MAVLESLLSQGVDRKCKTTHGNRAVDMAMSDEIKQVLMNYEKRVCMIVCDEIGKRNNTNVFGVLKIWDYLEEEVCTAERIESDEESDEEW